MESSTMANGSGNRSESDESPDSSFNTKDLRLDKLVLFYHDQIQRNADILKDDLETIRKRCIVPDLPKLVKTNKESERLGKSILHQFEGTVDKFVDLMTKLNNDLKCQMMDRFSELSPPISQGNINKTERALVISPSLSTKEDHLPSETHVASNTPENGSVQLSSLESPATTDSFMSTHSNEPSTSSRYHSTTVNSPHLNDSEGEVQNRSDSPIGCIDSLLSVLPSNSNSFNSSVPLIAIPPESDSDNHEDEEAPLIAIPPESDSDNQEDEEVPLIAIPSESDSDNHEDEEVGQKSKKKCKGSVHEVVVKTESRRKKSKTKSPAIVENDVSDSKSADENIQSAKGDECSMPLPDTEASPTESAKVNISLSPSSMRVEDMEHEVHAKDSENCSNSKEASAAPESDSGISELLNCPKLMQITNVVVERIPPSNMKKLKQKLVNNIVDPDDDPDTAIGRLEQDIKKLCEQSSKEVLNSPSGSKGRVRRSTSIAKNETNTAKKPASDDDSEQSDAEELSSESDSDFGGDARKKADVTPTAKVLCISDSSGSETDLEDSPTSPTDKDKPENTAKKISKNGEGKSDVQETKKTKMDKEADSILSKVRRLLSSEKEQSESKDSNNVIKAKGAKGSDAEDNVEKKGEATKSDDERGSDASEKSEKKPKKKISIKKEEDGDQSDNHTVVNLDSDSSDSDKISKPKTRIKKENAKRPASDSDDSDFVPRTRKKLINPSLLSKTIQRICVTDSDEEEQDEASSSTAKKKRAVTPSGSESDSSTKKRQPKKRRRIRKASTSDSDSDCVIVDSEGTEPKKPTAKTAGSPSRPGLRKVMSKKDLQKTTRQAGKDEEDRKRRVAENQKMYNDVLAETDNTSVSVTELVLDFDRTTKKPIVSVDPSIVKFLKPHQINGVKFMWENCYESVETIQKKTTGGGCILAHCMGLGKTLQTIAFLHTVMTSDLCKTKRALVICPLNTVGNWWAEFRHWCGDCEERVHLHRLWDFKGKQRFDALSDWERLGGVGIIHYDAFRVLANLGEKKKGKPSPRELKIVQLALLDPGPDIVVCDEGHLLKNDSSKQTQTVMKLRTARRIVLTGTPLQNDLMEYHTMMSFVKPNLLGTKKEFRNRFVNPIEKGQHKSSDQSEVQLMKRRAHVLHKLLDGCVQRLDYSVLTPYLPPKHEYAMSINLSQLQKDLYSYYLNNVSAKTKGTILSRQLFCDYQALVKVWTHPIVLTRRRNASGSSESDADSLKDFICDEETTEESEDKSSETNSNASDVEILDGSNKEKSPKEAEEPPPTVPTNGPWYSSIIKGKDLDILELSGKIIVLFEILKTCAKIGDKVLVFSQFLSSLNLIETFLKYMDDEAAEQDKVVDLDGDETETEKLGRWRPEIEYFRIDGSVKSDDRQKSCKTFNQDRAQCAKLFLISTKAGGLGINLTGANRVVMFDASWNPSHDIQGIFRVFRFGQTKPCYIYRLLARGTMEEKIYNRQVVKLSLSCRVVDEQQIERHFQYDEVQEMYNFNPNDTTPRPIPIVPKDRLLADLLISHKDWIFSYLEHDSLLENKEEETLTEEERRAAWEEYKNEDKPKPPPTNTGSFASDAWSEGIMAALQQKYPERSYLDLFYITQNTRTKFEHMQQLLLDIAASVNNEQMKAAYTRELALEAASLKLIFGDDTNWTGIFHSRGPSKGQQRPLQPQPRPPQMANRLPLNAHAQPRPGPSGPYARFPNYGNLMANPPKYPGVSTPYEQRVKAAIDKQLLAAQDIQRRVVTAPQQRNHGQGNVPLARMYPNPGAASFQNRGRAPSAAATSGIATTKQIPGTAKSIMNPVPALVPRPTYGAPSSVPGVSTLTVEPIPINTEKTRSRRRDRGRPTSTQEPETESILGDLYD